MSCYSVNSARARPQSPGSVSGRGPENAFLLATTLFVAVLIVEAVIVVIEGRSIPDIAALYAFGT